MDSSKVKHISKSVNQKNIKALAKIWFIAAEKGKTNRLQEIFKRLNLENKENFLHLTNNVGQTVLILAAKNGHPKAVDFIFDCFDKFDNEKTCVETGLSKADKLGRNALMWVAQSGHLETAEMLLNLQGVEPEDMLEILKLTNHLDEDVLAIAQKYNHPHMAQFLFTYFNGMKAAIENKNGSNKETEEEFNYFMMPLPASPRVKLGLPMSINNPVIFRDMPALALYPSAPIANTPEKDETEVIIRNFMGLRL